MGKRSKLLLVSWILGAIYLIYILIYFWKNFINSETSAEILGSGIALFLVAPHMFFVFLALIFNIIGWSSSKQWAALTGGILYSVAAIVFMLYCFFVIPSIVLSFVGFATLKGNQKNSDSSSSSNQEDLYNISLFDRLIPTGSIREKIFPPLCWIASFILTIAIHSFIFVR